MSIKPIDIKITMPKLQRISEINQIENNKSRNDVLTLEMQQQKRIDNESKKVVNTKETNKSRINNNNEKHNQGNSSTKKGNREKINKKKSNIESDDIIDIGKKIDIRI